MAGTIKFFDEMQNASNVSGQDKMMIGKAESGETQVITFDQAKQYLDITSNEIAPIVGGDSEANATPVPAGPAGQTRRADVAPGWIDFGSGPIEAAATNRWMAYWDGSSWSLVDMGELPAPDLDNQVSQEDSKAITPKGVDDYALPKTSPQILPDPYTFDLIERPDILNIPIQDKDDNIFRYIKTTSVPREEFVYDIIERPDLSLVVLDKDGNLFWSLPANSSPGSGGGNESVVPGYFRPDLKSVTLGSDNKIVNVQKMVENLFGYDFLTFVNPTEKPSFNVNNESDSWGRNYDELISKYDEIMVNANSNPESIVVEKGVYGTTGATGINQYFYRVRTTEEPKAKILLASGTHANEKMYIYGFYHMFKDLTQNPYEHPTLQWIRDNCEVVFIPCNCPESIGFPERINGGRTTPETRPFTASYSSDGSTITITYNQSDFPTENSGLIWNDYFQVQPDKRMITIWATDDDVVLPRGVYEYTVINGNTVTIEAVSATVKSGSCGIQVWVDPNRNVDNGKGYYQTYSVSNNIQLLDNGTPYALYDNKGTKAGSLQEIRNFIQFINDNEFDVVMDGHCPPRNHYVRAYHNNLIPNNINFMNSVRGFSSVFDSSFYDQNIDKYSMSEEPMWRGAVKNNSVIIEWGSGLVSATSDQITGAVRWAYTVMIGFLKHSVKIK